MSIPRSTEDGTWRQCGAGHLRSLAGVTSGYEEDTYAKDAIIGGETGSGMWMRQGDYTAVSVAPPYGPGECMLYNVAEDSGETRDLAEEQPELMKKLQAAWEQYAKDVGVILGKE